MRNYNIESDLKQEQFQTLKLVQGDRGNKIKINVYEDGQPVSLTGCSVTAKYKRADGEIINDGVIENIHDNSFDAVMDSSITKVAGTLKMLFTIEKDAVKVSAFLLLADVREGIGESSSSGGSAGGGEVTVDLTDYYKKIETYSRKEIDAQFKDIAKNKADKAYLNVIDFGAVGDGITDDTIAFQNAIDNLNAKYSTLYIPRGRYLITSPLIIELKNDITIYGDSKGDYGTVIDYKNTTIEYCFKIYGVNTFKMKNFRLLCNGNKGILFGDKDYTSEKYRSGNTLLEDIFIFNTLQGIAFDAPGGFNFFKRVGIDVSNNGTCICIGENFNNTQIYPNYMFINECNLQNTSNKAGTTGIKLNAVQYLQIFQTDIAGFDIGLKIENDKEISNLLISNNYFFKNKTSVYVKTSSSCRNITMRDNNHLFDNGTYLNIQNGTNTVYSFLIDGDYLQGSLKNGYILNNIYIKLNNIKSHFLKLNQNSVLGTNVNLDIGNLKPMSTTLTLASKSGKTLNFEVDTIPFTLSNAVVIHDNIADITQTQSNGILSVQITNTYTEAQSFIVFIP